MSNALFYAHTLPGQPEERWERLEVHLAEVAELAGRFGCWGKSRVRTKILDTFRCRNAF